MSFMFINKERDYMRRRT